MKSLFGSFFLILNRNFFLNRHTFDFGFGFFVKGIFKILLLIHYAANLVSLLFADDLQLSFLSVSEVTECPFSNFVFDTRVSK